METKSKKMAAHIPTPEAVRQQILRIVRTSHRKLTPPALQAALRNRLPASRKSVRTAIRHLVANRDLVYTQHYGCNFLEPAFNRPVRIADRVVVKPAGNRYREEPGDIVVTLAAGSAFGSGEHPTTRLATQAVEHILTRRNILGGGQSRNSAVLDVGTGSGVLVIAAVKLGIERGLGIDTDPCARTEARENVRLNRLQGWISISDQAVDSLSGPYSMITANLRYPSLCQMAGCLTQLTAIGGCMALSGFRPGEMQRVKAVYNALGFEDQWQRIELDWGGMALRRRGG